MSLLSQIFNIPTTITNIVNTTTGQATLSGLQAQVSGAAGLGRPNKYRVIFNMGPLIQNQFAKTYFNTLQVNNPNNTSRRLLFFCEGSELPGRQFVTTDQRFYGPTFKVPTQMTYPDVRFIFNIGADMQEKYLFDAWSYAIEDPQSHNFNYPYDYATSIEIDQLTEYNITNPIYSCILINAWPIQVDMLPMGFDKNNEIHKLGVTFTYKRWLPAGLNITVTDPGASGVSNQLPNIQNVIVGGILPPALGNLI